MPKTQGSPPVPRPRPAPKMHATMPSRKNTLWVPLTRRGSCCCTSSSCEPGRSRSSRAKTIWSQTLKTTSRTPFTNSHSGHRRSVHSKGTPFRNPRKSGGSPSGVSRPPQFETMKMKKITMWVRWTREAFARSSGRMSRTEAPVVPIRLASTAPTRRTKVLRSGVPEREPPMWMPPVTMNSDPRRHMKAMYSSAFSSSSWTPCGPRPKSRRKTIGAEKIAATIPLFRLLSQLWGATRGSTAIDSSRLTKGKSAHSGTATSWSTASASSGSWPAAILPGAWRSAPSSR